MQDWNREITENFFTTGIVEDLNFRFVLARNTSVATEAALRLDTDARVGTLLGEAMLASFFLATHSSKMNDTVSLHLEGEGPVHRLIAFASADGAMRAMTPRPEARWGGEQWDGIGRGILRVNRWMEDQQSYSSAVAMHGAHLSKNLQDYIGRSDQILSFLRLDSSIKPDVVGPDGLANVSGFLFQALPGVTPDQADAILDMIGERTPEEMISAMLQPADEAGGTHRPGPLAVHPVKILKNGSFRYYCDCSIDKVSRVLRLMGPESIGSLVAENGCVEVFCEFCKTRYELSPAEVTELFSDVD